MTRILSILLFFSIQLHLNAQDTLINPIDTLPETIIQPKQKKEKRLLKRFFKDDYPSPKKAVLLGIIPGMGQIYNKKYWKLPLVYGLLGGVIYSINQNTFNFRRAQNSLDVRNNERCQTGDEQYILAQCKDQLSAFPVNAITANRNRFDKNKQLSWIGLIGFYLISAGDAFVDAHLKDFSVDDDISFQPILETGPNNQPIMGIGITIPLGQ